MNEQKINSSIELSYFTYISPYFKENRPLNTYHYHYFCCYIWLLQNIENNSTVKFLIKKNKKRYFSLVKSSKCHKRGKYTFWFKSYKIIVIFLNFLRSQSVHLSKYLALFYFIRDFYTNLSSDILFQKRVVISLQSCLDFLNY